MRAQPHMLFNSLPFLYAFLPITYLVFWGLHNRHQRYMWLALTGYVFYGCWNYKFCLLMAASTLVSYLAGLGLLTFTDPRRRKLCLVLPVTFDLGLLGFFKYADFAQDLAADLARLVGVPLHAVPLHIVLPVGISFYTFHTITYIVDSYRGVIRPTRSLAEFACYVSLFAQLVAGPIVRFRQIEDDLEHLGQQDRWRELHRGWSFFVLGLIKKVLIADTIASAINPVLRTGAPRSTLEAWLGMLGYAYQLYFDFSGYSDMAVGLGLLFGLHLPQNFNSPYKALDPSDFWRRWHISLSTMLRDYLYIPLGGNRGSPSRTQRNLLLTMVLGGLWHGANWTFVIWGAYHGLLLVLYRRFGSAWDRLPAVLRRAGMFVLVLCGWVPFRMDSLAATGRTLRAMFTLRPGPVALPAAALLLLSGAAAVAHLLPNTFELSHQWRPWQVAGLTVLFALTLVRICAGAPSPFLYFQF